jgi:hypothetical protein
VSKIKKILAIFCLTILFVLAFSGCTNTNVNDSGEKFTFLSLQGDEINITQYRGKIVILDLFGVGCTWCVPQTFALEEIRNTYSKDDLVIITIGVWGDSSQRIQDLIEAYRCESPCDMEDEFSYLVVYLQGNYYNLRQLKAIFGMADGLDLDWTFGLDDAQGTVSKKYTDRGSVPKMHILDENGNIYYSFDGYTAYSVIASKLDEII